jgi:2-keto-3-deoxy-L-arabinonate dehydratase
MAFEGVRPVLHLPFATDDDILLGELAGLVGTMIDEGADGLVALGLASEAWTLTETERDAVLDTVATAIDGRRPLVVGIDGSTAVAVERGRRAATVWGAGGLMVLPPRGVQGAAQLAVHFGRLADAAGIPVLVQDSPQVTGVELSVETLLALARSHPLVGAVKIEIPGAGAKVSAAVEGGLEVVAGWGGLGYPESVARGAVGCMPGCDLGPAIADLDRRLRTGDELGATTRYGTILPLLAYETTSLDLLLLGAKRLLHRRGVFSTDRLRTPGRALDSREAASLDAIFGGLERAAVPGVGPVVP